MDDERDAELEPSRSTAQEHLRAVLDNAPQGVLVRTGAGRMLYVNYALARIHGFASAEELRATGDYTLHIHPDDRGLVTSRAQARVSNQSVPPIYEFRFLRRDGSVGYMEVNATRATWDGQPVSLSWLSDITPRKRAEEALQRSERLFVKVFQETPDPVSLTTVDEGRFVDVNEAYLRLIGRERSEVIGHTSLELGIWSDPSLRARIVERLHRDGSCREIISVAVQGDMRDFSLSGELVQFEGQQLLLMISHDVTEQRREEEARWRSQKLEALGTLAGGIAHDLNNTLVPVLALSTLTVKALPEGSRERKNLQIIVQGAQRARDLVRQILAFSREEKPEKAEIDIGSVLHDVLEMLRATIPATIKIEHDVGAVPPVWADAGQLHQVIVNLMTNAAQAIGREHGSIAVRLKRVARRGKRAGDWVCLEIADSGCGMDEETRRRMFEPFFTTKPVGDGTGLGLSVVHGIVTAHEGAIEVESAPRKGSTFRIFFPAHRRQEEAVPKKARAG